MCFWCSALWVNYALYVFCVYGVSASVFAILGPNVAGVVFGLCYIGYFILFHPCVISLEEQPGVSIWIRMPVSWRQMFAFGIVTLAMEWIFTLGAERLDESPQPWIFNYTYRAVGIMALGWIACFMSMSYSASTLGMTFKALQNLDVTLLPLPIVVTTFISNALWTVMGLCLGNIQVVVEEKFAKFSGKQRDARENRGI